MNSFIFWFSWLSRLSMFIFMFELLLLPDDFFSCCWKCCSWLGTVFYCYCYFYTWLLIPVTFCL